ncbi:MAG: ABC transporter permease [Fimbriimonadaceae bacterium]
MNWRLTFLIVGCLAAIWALLSIGGFPVATVFKDMVFGSFGNVKIFSKTLREVAPLLIAGTAVFVGLRAGLFNIGVEGQYTVGALACAAVAVWIPGPVGIVLGTICGMIVGALWAFPAAWIKAYRNGHEVITTIMLNNIATFATTALVAGPLKDPASDNTSTASIPMMLPSLTKKPEITIALMVGVTLVTLLWYWIKRTVAGYELEAVGANPSAAEMAGIAVRRVTISAMLASGAIAGLAGALQVLVVEGRFYKDFAQGYGFDSLGVALLAGGNPLGLIPSAFAFGAIKKGASFITVEHGVPKGMTLIILGFSIVVFAAMRYRKQAMRVSQ